MKKKSLTHDLTLYTFSRYPYTRKRPTSKRYEVTIGVGGNIGNMRQRFQRLLRYFAQHPSVTILATAPCLENPPFGFTDQPPFLNTIIVVKTDLPPFPFLKFLMHTEKKFGRRRSFKNGPRTLDLDIIFFETKVMYNEQLIIPHPHWQSRASVLIPLGYLTQPQRFLRYQGAV